MQKKQAKVFAGLLSMSLAVSLMTPLQGVSGQAARRKIALSKKSGTEEDNSYQKRKRKAYQMEY